MLLKKRLLRLLIAPSGLKPLTDRSAKALLALNDNPQYHPTTLNNQEKFSSIDKYQSSKPVKPLPRKCVLIRDSSFRGCGFRLTERENFDTPIVVEVYPNSPAKRSGLTEGDHIVYIETQNVQNLRFNNMTQLIQRTFEETGQVTLITLTGPGFQVLKQQGGYLENAPFDYQSSNINQMKPRLYKLKLDNHEHDFGFSLQRENVLSIKSIERGSLADVYGIRKGDVVLELNGQSTKYLSTKKINEIIEESQQERTLDILIIDIDGYEFSVKHAVPLNSLLSFVQTRDGRSIPTNNLTRQEIIYL